MMIKNKTKNMILLVMIFSALIWTSCSKSDPSSKLSSENKEQSNLIFKHRPSSIGFNCVSVYNNLVAWVVPTKPGEKTNQIVTLNIPNGKEKVVYTNTESGAQTDELILKSDKELIFCNWKVVLNNGYYWEINVLNTELNKIKKIASSNDRNSTVELPRLYSDGRYLSWLEISRKNETFHHTLHIYDFADNSLKVIASINQIYNPFEFYKIKNGIISWIDKKDSNTLLYIYDLNKNKLINSFAVGSKARGPISDGVGAVWAEGQHKIEGALFYKNLKSGNIITICRNVGNFDWTGNNIVYNKQNDSIEMYNLNLKTRTTLTPNGRLPSVNQDWVVWYEDMVGQDNSFILYPVNKV